MHETHLKSKRQKSK